MERHEELLAEKFSELHDRRPAVDAIKALEEAINSTEEEFYLLFRRRITMGCQLCILKNEASAVEIERLENLLAGLRRLLSYGVKKHVELQEQLPKLRRKLFMSGLDHVESCSDVVGFVRDFHGPDGITKSSHEQGNAHIK